MLLPIPAPSTARCLLLTIIATVGAAQAQQPFAECGTVIQGVTCPRLFLADSGRVYQVDGSFGSLAVGARVFVTGDFDPSCVSLCLGGRGCIFNSVISSCPQSLGTGYCSPAVPNSTGQPGVLSAVGSPRVVDNDVTLTADQVPGGQFGYFLVSQAQGLFNPPGSNGLLCLAGAVGRFNQPQNVGQGPTFSLRIDLAALPVNPPQAVLPGDTWNFQAWYRDLGNGNNFTDALQVGFL